MTTYMQLTAAAATRSEVPFHGIRAVLIHGTFAPSQMMTTALQDTEHLGIFSY